MTKAKKADSVFYSTIKAGELIIENILCRMYLPLKLTDSIELHFQPNDEQSKILWNAPFWKFSVEGEIKGYENRTETKITANEVWSSGSTENSHGFGLSETIMTAQPIDLRITDFLHGFSPKEKAKGKFWITPVDFFEPGLMVENSFTGNRKIKSVRQVEFSPDEQTKFRFERHFKQYKNDDDDDVSFSELVASFEIENADNDSPLIPEMLKKLDDVLLLASFAAKKYCVCLGWESFDSKTVVKQYLRDRSVPDAANSKRNLRDYVIDLGKFENFLKIAYPNLINYSDVDALRRAINFVIPSSRDTIDGGFMVMYSALEMLVLHFRRKQGLELIFSQTGQWKKVREKLKKFIEQLDLPDEDSDKRLMMKGKLSELNRISFATAFEDFCKHYSVNLDDLWSVTDNSEGISLSQLRNKLVHGEHFDSRHYGAIIHAKEHLRWTIDRMILGILGYPVENSNVSSGQLKTTYAYQDWRNDRKLLSE